MGPWKRFNSLMLATACLLMLHAVASAQLPTPTYGWNLGNTLEPPCGEGCWGPAATQALINAVADAGFNTVRLPCAWNSHANQTTYVIDPAYMARVKQVVDWCLARNLVVIVNCHWDGGWLENNITAAVNPTINAKQHAYWTQIANAFADYDDRLLFAGCNEPNADTAAQMATLLAYEQTFVNAVRAAGGANTTRWLVVQGPNTDIDLTYQLMNTLPTDPTPGRLMVEIHYYSPYQFTLMSSDASWGKMFYFWGQGYHHPTRTDRNSTWGEEDYMEAQFRKMKTKFIDQGIPVLLGEFCAMKRTGYPDLTGADLDLHLQGRTYFHETVVSTANRHGLKPVFWDIAGVTFNWTTGTEVDPDNIDALTGGGDATPPSPPANLEAQLNGIYVELNWQQNTEEDLGGYNVYRSTASGGGYVKVNGSPVTQSAFVDTGAPGGQTVCYVVTAVDTAGNESGPSNEARVTTPMTALGTILHECWIGISGSSVGDLTSHPDYPDSPFTVGHLTRLEGSTDWTQEYGTRIRGCLYPPASGSYTFWLAGDDNCQLWLSPDGAPGNVALIATVPGWTNSREWEKYPQQQSSPITLAAGQKYYIEVLHKEGYGGDNVAVAWAGPGISRAVIEGVYLSPWPTGLYGDFDGSGTVELDDLAYFAGLWLTDDCALTSGVDLDGDCVVNLYEFSRMAQNGL